MPPPIITTAIERAVPIETLVRHPDNPRRGDVDAIATSVTENGFYGTVVVQRSSRLVLAGNHRLAAADGLGMATVDVAWVDVDDTVARRIMLADNRTNDLAGYDDHALVALLVELADDGGLLGTGYDQDDLDALLHKLEAPDLDELAERVGGPTVADGYKNVTLTLPLALADALEVALRDTGLDRPAADTELMSAWLA